MTSPANPNPAGTTPREWKSLPDSRQEQGAGTYPNYWTHRTRSGHVFNMDDSQGNESVTLQHRGGSMIQMRPDGSVQITSHNGQYNIVFGENRMKITGAQDLTVEGAQSLRVKGPSNTTVEGGTNWAIKGDFNVLSENVNMAATKNFNVAAAGNVQMRAGGGGQDSGGGQQGSPGNVELSSVGGAVSFTSDKDVMFASKNGNLLLGGKKVAVSATDEMRLTSQSGIMHIRADNEDIRIHAKKKVHMKAEDESIHLHAKKNINEKTDSGVVLVTTLVEGGPPEAEQGSQANQVAAVGSEGSSIG